MKGIAKAALWIAVASLLGWGALPLAAAPAVDPDAVASAAGAAEATARPLGNPLWAIPLKELSATRERPLFSPSRRPPPAAVTAPPPPAAAPSAPSAPPRPSLALLGTILNGRDGYGLFLDEGAGMVRRLRIGQAHEGWTLRALGSRDATLEKERNIAVLALPPREAASPAGTRASQRPAGSVASRAQRPPASEAIFYPEH